MEINDRCSCLLPLMHWTANDSDQPKAGFHSSTSALQRLQALRAPTRVAAHHSKRYFSMAPSGRLAPRKYQENLKSNFLFFSLNRGRIPGS